MKKMILVLLIALLLGCEDSNKKLDEKEAYKTLTCNVNDQLDDYYETEDTYFFIFDESGKSLKEYKEEQSLVYRSKFSDENKKEVYEQALHQCDIYNQYDGIKCQIIQDDKGLSINIKVVISELTTDKVNLEDREKELYNNYTYEQLKEREESFGRTCK